MMQACSFENEEIGILKTRKGLQKKASDKESFTKPITWEPQTAS